jgi:hypothetical protein
MWMGPKKKYMRAETQEKKQYREGKKYEKGRGHTGAELAKRDWVHELR